MVSVITIVLNGEAHLEQAILSVLVQDYGNIEYIVVDGASTDGTLDIIRKYEDRIDYWISESDAGIYDAMNKGIALASGDVIGIINSDDFYAPGTIGLVAAAAARHPEAGVFHGRLQFIRNSGVVETWVPAARMLPAQTYRMPVNHPTVFVRADLYRKFGTFNTSYRSAADLDLILRFLFDHGVSFHYLDAVLAGMREGGKSGQYSRETYREIREILRARRSPAWATVSFRVWYRWLMLLQSCSRFAPYRALARLYYRFRRESQ